MSNQTASTPSAFQRHLPFFHRVVCSRRWWKALGFTAVGLVTVTALFFAVENWRGARAWKKVRDELRAKGEPLSFAELVPPMPLEDENFAMTPFFRGFFDKSISADGKTPVWSVRQQESKLPDWPDKLQDDRNWRLGERHEFAWNRRVTELQNSPVQKESAQEELAVRSRTTDRNELDGVDLTANKPIETVRQLLEKSRPVMAEIETAVLRPKSQFPVHYEDNISAIIPHVAKLKTLGRLFSLRALVHLEASDAEASLKDVATTLRLAESLKSEPILISALVRISILELAMQPVWQGLANRRWDDGQLRTLQTQLNAIDLLAAYSFSIRGERMFALDFCDLVERERNLGDMGMIDDSSDSHGLRYRLWNYAPRGWYAYNKAAIARLMGDTLPAIDPVEERFDPASIKAYESGVDRLFRGDARLLLARHIVPAVGKAAQRFALGQTSLDQALIACALERHRLGRGGYPATLAELVPDYLAKVPHDIMDGQPMRYRLADGKFTLYSIGVNGADDGGQAVFKEVRDGKTWRRDEGDWVWTYPPAEAK